MAEETWIAAELPEGWEEWLAFLSAQLPDPVKRAEGEDGSVTFTAGEPGEVIVRLTPTALHVGEFTVEWDGHTPHPAARWMGRVYWTRMPAPKAIAAVEALVDAARAVRRATFRTCEICDKTLPPEAMLDEATCQACADREQRLVF